jgi:hypothetical protein
MKVNEVKDSERETLLAVGPPDEWWKWADDPWDYPEHCLLCQAYNDDCIACKVAGGHDPSLIGCKPPMISPNEYAPTRLRRAGIERPESQEENDD